MPSLTTCLKKAGDHLHPEDRAAIVARSEELRKAGKSTAEAAVQAVQERIDHVAGLRHAAGDRPPEAAPKAADLTEHLRSEILAGRMPKDNPALKRIVAEFEGKEPDQARMKRAQEELEAAIVQVARKEAAAAPVRGDRSTFDRLLALYESQPNLNIRTSSSIANQAYSTPAPLAYLASRLTGIGKAVTVLEPTAGTGMLVMQADPAKTQANEIDPVRQGLLLDQGFDVTRRDATEPGAFKPGSVDRMIANPPFGGLHDAAGSPMKVEVDGYKLGQVDHLIAARALAAMKDDGRATLILGADKSKASRSNDARIFLNWLYAHYNVVSHFEVEGDLYARQGAGWPVRVITVAGRAENPQAFAPAPDTITRATDWSAVYEQFDKGLAAVRAGLPAAGGDRTAGTRPAGVPVAAPAQAGGADRGGPEGRAASAGGQPRELPGNVGDRGERAPAGVGGGNPAQRLDERTAGAGELGRDVASPPARERQPRADRGTSELTDPDNQFQAKYKPRSGKADEGVLIPVNMAGPTQQALDKLEDAVGDIDEFAARELGYDSIEQMHEGLMGLQVDAVASAIHQMKQNKGLIIADQTGIGKGRQAAAIIRWALKNGKVPVFVTVKPSLFTDMHGDLHDIGSDDVAPFIVNSAESIKGADGERLFANRPATHRNNLEHIAATGTLPAGRNAMFLTYSQINVDNLQRRALLAVAPNAVLVLDESHNAGGDSATGDFIQEALGLASGATYLSATYAKRPDNMPVYFKTDIGEAIEDKETLGAAMDAGGLPLQTVVANNLVKAGQMFRRERSYEGVNIATKTDVRHSAEHRKLSDATTEALRAIVAADRMFHEVFFKAMKKEMEKSGERAMDIAGNQASESVNHTEFSSVVHNFVRQMLLGLKAQEAADLAIARLKSGEKPLIALENTMGSFLAEYADANGLKPGDALGQFDYRNVLSRALTRTRAYVVEDSKGEKRRVEVKLGELDDLTRSAYNAAQRTIDKLNLSIPVSPIDWMRQQLTNAGYSVKEITGRSLAVDYSDPARPVLTAIDHAEQKDKVETTRAFNDGRLDALVLNVAGSTGISLHASERFKDQRPRHMIVAQPAQDINIFMQMLGRVHRTGQVRLPGYTLLNVDLPAEKRPTALLSKKMKSLNANTSSNTESATSVKAADLLNKYGDQVVARYLADNLKLSRALGIESPLTDEGKPSAEDLARKATGRLALMPVEVQEQFYAEVEDQYNTLIQYLNDTNQNDLEPRTFDLDARELRSETLFEGQNPGSPFGENATYGEYSIKSQGKAMTPAEIQAEIADSLGSKKPGEHAQALQARLDDIFGPYRAAQDPEDQADADATRRAGVALIGDHHIGSMWRVEVNGDTYNAVVTDIRNTHKAGGNPFSLSKFHVTMAVNGGLRRITVPGTQLAGLSASYIGQANPTMLQRNFGVVEQGRETAKIVTGNLLAAYGEIEGSKGTIITFTKGDGTTEQGILLPKKFNFAKEVRQDYRLRNPGDVVHYLTNSSHENIDRFGVVSRDSGVRIMPGNERGGITIQVPKSKAKGGKFFLDSKLLAHTGDFVSSGNFMKAYVPAAKAEAAVARVMQKNALYVVASMAKDAKEVLASRAGEPDMAFSEAPAPGVNQPSTKASALAEVRSLFGDRADGVVTVVEDAADLPDGLRQRLMDKNVQGVTVANRHVYVIADRVPQGGVRGLVMHELGVHYGMRDEQIRALTEQVVRWASGTGPYSDLAKEAIRRASASTSTAGRHEETLAYFTQFLVDKGIDPTQTGTMLGRWWKTLVDALKRAARALGLNVEVTPQDVVDYAYGAANIALARGVSPKTAQAAPAGRAQPVAAGQQHSEQSTRENTPAFKRWFGDSKVVDDSGAPMVVYHGTNKDISTFDGKKPMWFAADHQLSERFVGGGRRSMGKKPGKGAVMYPVYLSLQNPLDLTDLGLGDKTSMADLLKMAGAPSDKAALQAIARANLDSGNSMVAPSMGDPVEYLTQRYQDGERLSNLLDDPGLIAALKKAGIDGLHLTEEYEVGPARAKMETMSDTFAVFDPSQVKSATGNNGNFDPNDDRIAFSQGRRDANNSVRDDEGLSFSESGPALASSLRKAFNDAKGVKLPAGYVVGDLFDGAGKLHWWHKTVGTPHHLAETQPAFKPVYEAVQNFLNDVSLYAAEAADKAPTILPTLETWRDLAKSPLSAADTKAIAAPIFEGTLLWARDANGKPVKVDDLRTRYDAWDTHQKASELLRQNAIAPHVLRMWQGLPMAQYEQAVASKFDAEILKAGIVWKPAELKAQFGLSDAQVNLYQQFREAVDTSLDNLVRSEVVKLAGEDAADLRDEVLTSGNVDEAAMMLRDHFFELAHQALASGDKASATAHNKTADRITQLANKVKGLKEAGYAPLSRYGEYTLDVVAPDGERLYFGMFDDAMDRSRMERQMRAEYPEATITSGTVSQRAYELFAGVSPETLQLFGEILGLDSTGDSAADRAFQQYLQVAHSNRSAVKRLIHRKGIAGYSEDVGRVLAGFIYSNARATSGNLHMGAATRAAEDIPKQQGQLKDTAVEMLSYVKNPQQEAQKLRGLLFAQYLGGSIASAMVNALQPLNVTLPYLSQYGGMVKASEFMKAGFSLAGKKDTGDEALNKALKHAEEEGIVSPQEVHQLQAQASGRATLVAGDGTKLGNALAATRNNWSRLTIALGKVFSVAEQWNRRVTFIAAYRAAQAQGMPNPAAFAAKAVADTQFTYNKGNKPKWARGAIGSVLFTFKQYSVSYLELMHRMWTQGGPEGKKAVLYAMAILFLMSGAGGLPFEDDAEDVLDGFMQRLGYNFDSKRAKHDWLVKTLGEGFAHFVEHGASGMPGMPIDVSGRLGMGNLLPGTGMFTKKEDHTSDVAELAGPVADLGKRAFQSAGKLVEGHPVDAMTGMLPNSAQNAMKAWDMFQTGMYRDVNGKKVIDTDMADAAAKAIGFQPNDVARAQESDRMVQDEVAQTKLHQKELSAQLAKAIFDRDEEAKQGVRDAIARWNEANPEAKIKPDSVFTSARHQAQQMRLSKAQRIEKSAPAGMRQQVRERLEGGN